MKNPPAERPLNELGRIQSGIQQAVYTRQTKMARRRPMYCEAYPAMVPPTMAPQLEMIVALEERSLDSFLVVVR
jgi:hypothetical protein